MTTGPFTCLAALIVAILTCATRAEPPRERAQVPTWSRHDIDFFLHGSMSTEVVPEAVLRAFIRIYPDLFPRKDLTHLGLIADPAFGWPLGFSRSEVKHLGGLSAVGINCAACHVTEVLSAPGATPVRVFGVTAHFDAEAFFGTVIVATFRTAEPANMRRFLAACLAEGAPAEGADEKFAAEWQRHEQKIVAEITADPFGAKGVGAGELHALKGEDLRLDAGRIESTDLAVMARAFLRLFHNMRAALHIPDQPPDKAPPASGPGRNDAFGLLSAALLGAPRPYAPVKYGLVWNLKDRHWVHWDGNSRSPLGRNLLASLGLGAPLMGRRGELDLEKVKRHTELTERIRAPRYPFAIDTSAAKRGADHYQKHCATCHDGPESDARLHDIAAIGTSPERVESFTSLQADGFNTLLADLEVLGYQPGTEDGLRSTGKIWVPSLHGVWARSPYLHNGSVRTMRELLTTPAQRAKTFRRGSRVFDADAMGYTDEGTYILDTTSAGNSSAGHAFGTDLSADEKRDLIEHLKTL